MKELRFAFSVDYDWASEAVLEYALDIFFKENIPLTIFATHNSDFVLKHCKSNQNIELQVHPNFCPNSSHGNSYKEVFQTCEQIQSEKTGFRCHRYFESNDINDYFLANGYKYSSNICTNLNYVAPFNNRHGLLSIPLFMEDGGFLFQKRELNLNSILCKLPKSGTVVFNFHPMHIAFNSYDLSKTVNFRNSLKSEEYQNISHETIRTYLYSKFGIRNLLFELLAWGNLQNIQNVLLKSLINEE